MKKKPLKNEDSLVGNWIEKDNSVIQDHICQRIQWLTENYFEPIAVDGPNWSALFKDPDDKSFWELTYPKSHMHGGGPPTLQRITIDEANKRYKII